MSLQSHPIDTEVAYWEDQDEADQWNEIRQVVEPRHLAKRSPFPPFDPISKKVILKTKIKGKKFLLKAKKTKPIWKPKAKKLAILSVPLAVATGGAGFGGLAGGVGLSQVLGGGQGFQIPNFG